jgi:hypothetical protein
MKVATRIAGKSLDRPDDPRLGRAGGFFALGAARRDWPPAATDPASLRLA